MKISLGFNLQESAFGGGNQFGRILANYLTQQGVSVSYDLADPDLDIILLAEPDYELQISAYDHHQILDYLRTINPKALVVHRLNNSSQARDDHQGKFNRFRVQANQVADFTVFVSQWLYECYQEAGFTSPHYQIIHNGGDKQLWRPATVAPPAPPPFRAVTHHWSTHPNKGFDIYQQIDHLLTTPQWKGKLEFTYIGRLPDGFTLPHTRCLPPLSGQALADELSQHHIYITASRFEAGPNHCIEGALCGLPLLYIQSGAMPEYGADFGLGFTPETFETQLSALLENYAHYKSHMPTYPFTDENMVRGYFQLFQELMKQRDLLITQRRWMQSLPNSPHAPEAQINWLQGLRPHILGYLDSLQGEQKGQYRIANQGLTPEGAAIQLPWSCWALKIHHILGAWDDLPEHDQQGWIQFILRFQVEGNPQFLAWGRNAFRDPALITAVMHQTRRLTRWKQRFLPSQFPPLARVLSAETKQAIASLQEIGIMPPLPYQGFPTTRTALNRYLQSLDWGKPWMSGAHLATLAVFYRTEAPRFLPPDQVQQLIHLCTDFLQTLADPQTGGYFHQTPPPYGELVNGAMKILTALDWFQLPVHYPESLIDTVLADIPEAEGCHLVDAVYVLYRCQQQTDHRRAEIAQYCLNLVAQMVDHFNPIDGGFSYYQGRSQSHIHHVRVTRQRPISDLHGTLLLTWAASMILDLLGESVGWRILRP